MDKKISKDFFPLILIIPIPPLPVAVDIAAIVLIFFPPFRSQFKSQSTKSVYCNIKLKSEL